MEAGESNPGIRSRLDSKFGGDDILVIVRLPVVQ